MTETEKIKQSAEFLQANGIADVSIGIVLGTGLGNLITKIEIEKEIPYESIPGFPVSTVEFHSGKLIFGNINGKQVLAMNGRFHAYEGYSMKQITFPIRVMKLLGIETLLISNAAGGMNLEFRKGDLMVVADHINLQPDNPLIGKNLDDFGPRFPDMSEAYDKDLRKRLLEIAIRENIKVVEGIYVSVPGPNLETAAEYRFLHRIGADAVGMSTVPEVIVARHQSMRVAAISVITDECDPDHLQPVNIAEIIEVAGKAEVKLSTLFSALIAEL